MQALQSLGVSKPSRNFIVASQGPLNEDGIPVVVLAKRSPFTAEEEVGSTVAVCAITANFLLFICLRTARLNPFSALIASNDALQVR